MSDILDIYDIYQQRQIRRNEAADTAIRANVAEVKTSVQALAKENERLKLLVSSLWDLLKESHGFTDEHLIQCIEKNDLSSGVRNASMSSKEKPMQKCPNCSHKVPVDAIRCAYCGNELERKSIF